MQVELSRKATEHCTREGSQEGGCKNQVLHFLASKCSQNKETFSSADQTSLSPLSTKGGKIEMAPKKTVFTIDHLNRFGAFVKSALSRSINARSASTYTTRSHPILLPINLRPTFSNFVPCIIYNVTSRVRISSIWRYLLKLLRL